MKPLLKFGTFLHTFLSLDFYIIPKSSLNCNDLQVFLTDSAPKVTQDLGISLHFSPTLLAVAFTGIYTILFCLEFPETS